MGPELSATDRLLEKEKKGTGHSEFTYEFQAFFPLIFVNEAIITVFLYFVVLPI